jgi:hypothetical protein
VRQSGNDCHIIKPIDIGRHHHTTIHNVLSITVLCDIIFGMIHPREMITSLTRVCNEWNRKYTNRSSIHRERYWRQILSSSTISSIILRPQRSFPLQAVDETNSLVQQHDRMTPTSNQLLNVVVGGSKGRSGWCQRVVAHSTLRDRWRSGRYKKDTKNPLRDLLSSSRNGGYHSSVLLCNGSYLLGLSVSDYGPGEQLLVLWDLTNDFPIKQFSIPSEGSSEYNNLVPISESSMCVLAIGHDDVTLVNMNSGDWSEAIATSNFDNDFVIASHGQPNQPMAYVGTDNNIIEEWDLVGRCKVREIVTQVTALEIAMNDDHTCIARSGYFGEPVAEIIDRRTSLPVHQIKDEKTEYSRCTGIKWHDNHIMMSHLSRERTVQLYDIRKGGSSQLAPSRIWAMNPQEETLIDFSNDFQIALLHSTDWVTSVVDLTSSSLRSLYKLPIEFGAQMTYDRLLEVHEGQLFDFS